MSAGRNALIALAGLAAAAAVYQGVQEAQSARLLPAGAEAPDFVAPRLQGGSIALSSLRGKVVLLDFWASWCGPCRARIPGLLELQDRYRAQGLELVAVNQEGSAGAAAVVDAFVSAQAPALREHVVMGNDAVAAAYRIESLPTLYIIGRDGRVERGMDNVPEFLLRRRVEAAVGRR